MHLITSSIFLVASLYASTSFAEGYFRLGGVYLMDESGDEGDTSDSTRTLLDIGGGYISPKGWTIGALYGTEKLEVSGSSVDRTAMGPTVGWISRRESGPYILGTYFLSVERDTLKGKGYQVDIGYKFALRRISFAPQLSYRSLTYDEISGQSLTPKYLEKKIDPYFVLLFEF